MKVDDQVWRETMVVQRYLEGVRGAIPLAAEQFDVLLRVVRSARPQVKHFLDLGCGDGVLGRILMEAHREARGVFMDFSEPMLEAARLKFADLEAARYRLVRGDYGRRGWADAIRAEG